MRLICKSTLLKRPTRARRVGIMWSCNRFALQKPIICTPQYRPTENAFVERVIRTLKEEEVSLNEYADFADAEQRIGQFLDDVYNTKRVHSALGYRTPAEYEALMRSQQQDRSEAV